MGYKEISKRSSSDRYKNEQNDVAWNLSWINGRKPRKKCKF